MRVGRLRWFKTIRAQLTLGFGVILLLHGLSAAIGYGSLQRLRSRSQTTLDNAAQLREWSLELKTNFLLARQAEEAFFDTWQGGNMDATAQVHVQTNQAYLAQARQNLADLRALEAQNPELAEEFALLDSLFDNYESAFETTTRRIAEDSLNHKIHQQLEELIATLPSDSQASGVAVLRGLVWQLMAEQQAYLNTQDPAYLDDLQSGLDQLGATLDRLPAGTLDPAAQALIQTYMLSLNTLLFLDQQVQVNRIIAANVNRDINDIIQTVSDRSATRAAAARLELDNTANQSSAALLATALTALALAIWASVVLRRRIMTPLTLMAIAAERIAQHDLSQPLRLRGDNEFTAVAQAFNHMVSQLRQTLDTLEQRVDERTTALATANQTLQQQTQSLEIALQKLRHSEANYRLLVDHLHAGVIVHAADTSIVMCNQMAVQLLGMPMEVMVGQQTDYPWAFVDEAGAALTPEHYPVTQVIASQRPLQNLVLGICSPQTQDCTWVLVNAFPTFDEAQGLTQVVVTFIDISDRKLAEEELRHQALHDALTGLPNRALFTERLEQAVQRARRYPEQLFAVLFIDLDRFKVINDSLGHLVGDQLLLQIAHILQRHVRASDTVARLGGDEFVILLEHITSLMEAIHVVERIQADVKAPFTLMGHTVFTSVSLGIALASPSYERGEDMLRDADNAMYRAKARGQSSGYEIFNPTMHASAIQLFELETQLRQALEHQDFILHYQPIVHLATQRLLGFEALVRWVHPQRGLIHPGEFISLAEETGLIIPLSEWIFEAACRQMADWRRQFPAVEGLKMNVNVAAAQFERPKFFEQIKAILERTSLPATNLGLEVTESLLLLSVKGVLSTLSSFQAYGIDISIDDFGTGYSSLSYLKQFPINTLKIDQSFVENIDIDHDDISIVKAIIQIARSLGMKVVAEGVETEFQRHCLGQLGCDAIQGYWIASPLSPDQAELFIQRQGHRSA
ncbi:EAL domain-containing protein [Nodosilinea sp. LEGE 06152]|uniref:EAL domain-containing protein n=1 Tax=Nodosilinea sp. LEGE 06152 TaxID=2777966 RepID=UPI00188121A7|nr:EAL domain-containing protein [Nodosilinea sp. LEGE 06152]MBE9155954.1 EAL domain-containing protein [Nodosilinea sp. LEGE 06152]